MMNGQGAPVMDHFRGLEDPRIERSKRHRLLDIVAIAICAVICGAGSWVCAEMSGKSKGEWLRSFLDLPGSIPSHDTFGGVFSRLDPERFQQCFVEWTQAAPLPGGVVAIDGRTVRRSRGKAVGKQAIPLVSARASPELAGGQHDDPGAGQDGGEIQRNHGHTPVAGNAGPERLHRDHRRHGLPEGNCSEDRVTGAWT